MAFAMEETACHSRDRLRPFGLHDGREIRLLAIVDNFTRECVALDVNFNFPADRVVSVLQKVALRRGRPQQIRVDNGPEFVSKQLDQWAYGIRLSSTFHDLESRQITLSSNRSTIAFGRNC
jgi:transposase InsO family protein